MGREVSKNPAQERVIAWPQFFGRKHQLRTQFATEYLLCSNVGEYCHVQMNRQILTDVFKISLDISCTIFIRLLLSSLYHHHLCEMYSLHTLYGFKCPLSTIKTVPASRMCSRWQEDGSAFYGGFAPPIHPDLSWPLFHYYRVIMNKLLGQPLCHSTVLMSKW